MNGTMQQNCPANVGENVSCCHSPPLGIPQSNYYAMKRGENISTHTVNELCRLLACNVSDIMTYVPEKE